MWRGNLMWRVWRRLPWSRCSHSHVCLLTEKSDKYVAEALRPCWVGSPPPPQTCGSHTLVAKGRVKELTAWEVSAAPLSPPSTSSYPFQLLGWFLIQSPLPRPPPPLLTPRCCPHTSKWLQTLTEQHQSNNPGISSKSLQPTCEAEGWAAQKQDLCLLFLQGSPPFFHLLSEFIGGGRIICSGALCFDVSLFFLFICLLVQRTSRSSKT